ncbi:hypothetical protein [Pseudonocardia acidicola]|uniref:Uncharacterized protein n=1 Tax=Pseudonocardia acidicola TaxID=2724939 RepID=A0ABX1S9R3_9PSEU|nr:hypothetical protein [Pseudonocardia acidicola]NMH97552.1 hypothetical protein [Pseudonocardia acidicola]
MQLVTYRRVDGTATHPCLGILQGDRSVDLARAHARTGAGPVPESMPELLRLGDAGLGLARAAAEWADEEDTAALDAVRLCVPLPRPTPSTSRPPR